MMTSIDGETLIACLACAKAKARCDKRLPKCSRCLFKQLQCEPRQPRRYPEAFQSFPSQSPLASHTTTLPSPNPPPPQYHIGLSAGHASFAQIATFEDLHWGTAVDNSSRDLPMADSNRQPFDFGFLDASDPFVAHFTANAFRIATPQTSTSPPDARATTDFPTLDDWPCFGCNPPTHRPINPENGGGYLSRLEKTLDEQTLWDADDFPTQASNPMFHVEPVQESLRDKLMVVSQGFFSRAREIHSARMGEASIAKGRSWTTENFSGFFILPPSSVLEAFLRTYSSRVEPYTPFFPAAKISPFNLIVSSDEKASILLLLLMIAHGAMGYAHPEARSLASGLIEMCRICIFDVMEKNVQLSAHPVMLQCALLYLQASAWSGNKWHMDLSAAQLRMFTSILRHSRILSERKSAFETVDVIMDVEADWKKWQVEERLNRLAYSWVKLDQEMNLFHDRQPDLDVCELDALIPECDSLWNANSSEVWLSRFADTHKVDTFGVQLGGARRSLANLFGKFMRNELSESSSVVSIMELRLLLHPLQALIYHLNRSLVYFFTSGSQRLLQRLFIQLEEVQYLLEQWHTIAQRTLVGLGGSTDQSCCTMIMYHLVCLNTLTYFPDIERLARGDCSPKEFCESLAAGKRCSEHSAQIWCHCGQVLRYFRQLPFCARPYWWSGSIYRIALCMWATSLASQPGDYATGSAMGLERISVDSHPFNHPTIVRFLRRQDGTPIISHADGSPAQIDTPLDVISQCIAMLTEEGTECQLDEGIKARLSALVDRLSSD